MCSVLFIVSKRLFAALVCLSGLAFASSPAVALDITIQAENYSNMSGVQIEATSDTGGGDNVGWIDSGDWMSYANITFPTTGSYIVEYRVASLNGGGMLSLDLNGGQTVLGQLSIPSTGGWQNWTTVSHTVNVNAGTYGVGIYAVVGGWNLNWLRIRNATTGATLTNGMVYELRFPNLQNKCMDVSASNVNDGANVQLWSCNGAGAQRFKVMTVDGAWFQLVSTISGRCVEAAGGGTSDGTNVQMWACNGTEAQQWKVEQFADGNYHFPNRKSGRCLDVSTASSADGANIQLWGCNDSNAQRIRANNAYADTAIEYFNDTYLHLGGPTNTYYRTSIFDTGPAYFWIQALNIMMLEDSVIRSPNPRYQNIINDLLETFNVMNGMDWTWNQFFDDYAWASLAFVRGGRINNNSAHIQKARDGFDYIWQEGWSADLGGGVWWDKAHTAKEALSNGPTIYLGCLLYQSTGNAWYRDRAIDIYAWMRNNLYNTSTGQVYQKKLADGTLDTTVSNFNVGAFISAANCLYTVTGNAMYYSDAQRSADWVINNMTVDGIEVPIGSAEFARGLGEFMRDRNLYSTYLGWMQQNSQAAWNIRRTDRNISWGHWREQTPTNQDLDSLTAREAASHLQWAPW